ncbi:MAG: hypothetical protein FWD50_03930 [Betaproteobacteria bacterium]|nr:hypothetical protein [Betaproteobacteria bacterium]
MAIGRTLLFALAAASLAPQLAVAQAVYKCKIDGRTVYATHDCGNVVQTTPMENTRQTPEERYEGVGRTARANAIRQNMIDGQAKGGAAILGGNSLSPEDEALLKKTLKPNNNGQLTTGQIEKACNILTKAGVTGSDERERSLKKFLPTSQMGKARKIPACRLGA